MGIHYDDFSTYESGDLAGQGGWGHYSSGLLSVTSGGTYAHATGTTHEYRKSLQEVPDNTKAFFSSNIYLQPINNTFMFGLAHGGSDGCCIYLSKYRYDNAMIIHCGSFGNPTANQLCYAIYNPAISTYIEYIHDFGTGMFEYVKCINPNFIAYNKSGYSLGAGMLTWRLQHIWYPNNFRMYDIYTEVTGDDEKKYLHYPRWQPTKYGMRPFY